METLRGTGNDSDGATEMGDTGGCGRRGLGRHLRVWIGRPLGYGVGFLLAIILTVFGVGSLIPGFVVALGLVGVVAFRRRLRRAFTVGLAVCVAIIVWRSALSPSNERDWQRDLTVLVEPTLDGDTLTMKGVRNFRWGPDGREILDERWETRSYRLRNLRGLDLIVEPFIYSDLMAHTMLSFDFGEDGRLLLSIEARKEVGENYQPVLGGLSTYELIYLFLDERDGFGVRAAEGYELYAYPVKVDALSLRAFFLSLCRTADNLRRQPRFYHIIRDNCTTVWIEQADNLSVKPIGLRWESVANGLIAKFLFSRGMIATDLDYEAAKRAFRIDEAVRRVSPEAEDFSEEIRADFPS